jgi:hypothetical protein
LVKQHSSCKKREKKERVLTKGRNGDNVNDVKVEREKSALSNRVVRRWPTSCTAVQATIRVDEIIVGTDFVSILKALKVYIPSKYRLLSLLNFSSLARPQENLTSPQKMAAQISKKRKFVADGVFRAELNEFFTRELAEEGYSGCDVRVTHARTEVRPKENRQEMAHFKHHNTLDHHPCNSHSGSPRREGPSYS